MTTRLNGSTQKKMVGLFSLSRWWNTQQKRNPPLPKTRETTTTKNKTKNNKGDKKKKRRTLLGKIRSGRQLASHWGSLYTDQLTIELYREPARLPACHTAPQTLKLCMFKIWTKNKAGPNQKKRNGPQEIRQCKLLKSSFLKISRLSIDLNRFVCYCCCIQD